MASRLSYSFLPRANCISILKASGLISSSLFFSNSLLLFSNFLLKPKEIDMLLYHGDCVAVKFIGIKALGLFYERLLPMDTVEPNYNYSTMCQNVDECLDKINKHIHSTLKKYFN